MRGQTLISILNSVRVHARLSLSPAHNVAVRDSQVVRIQQEQTRLWGDYDWPHLRVKRYIPLAAGQYLYDPPDDLDFDRIERVEVYYSGMWVALHPGITAEHYFLYDPLLDQRSWPVRRVQVAENDQIEVWPLPDTNADATTQEGMLRLTGIRKLRPLVADADVADLDDQLLALYVAAPLLAASNAKDGDLKLRAANLLYGRLKGSQVKVRRFNMFSTTNRQPASRREFVPRYIPPSV